MSSAVWLWGEYHCLSFVSTRHCTVIFQKVSFLGLRQLLHKHSLTSILMSICCCCHFHALEKETTTHSSVPARRIPGTGEPGGLPSMGSHRGGHDWSDLPAVHNPGSLIHLSPDFCSMSSSFVAVQLTLGFTSTIQEFGLRSPAPGVQPGHSLKAVSWVSGRAHFVFHVLWVAVLCCLVYSVWKTGYFMFSIFFILRVVFGVWVRFQGSWWLCITPSLPEAKDTFCVPMFNIQFNKRCINLYSNVFY